MSPEQIYETASFLVCWYEYAKIKNDRKFWLRKVDWDFLHIDADSQKLKARQKCIG